MSNLRPDLPDALTRLLSEPWCSELEIARDGNALRLSMPLLEPDGDFITIWLRQTMNGWRLEDAGATLMRVSYHSDALALLRGPRRAMLDKMLAEHGARFADDGQIVSESDEQLLGIALLRFGQGLLRVSDPKIWN